MATTVKTMILDDLDGSEGEVETVTFALHGMAYEIDLNATHVADLEAALEQFVLAARKVGEKSRRAPAASVASAVDVKAVRSWAAERGIVVAQRGRVSKEVVEQYLAAA